jgi:hypothetical protein
MSVFRLKSDGSEAATPLDELRAEALVYGIVLELEMQLDGKSVSIPAPGDLKPLPTNTWPAQAQEILYELLTKHWLKMIEALNCERRALGQKPVGDPAFLAKWKANFEKAYYGRFRRSEQGRRVVDLLKAWRGSLIAEQRGWLLREDWGRIALFEPLLHSMRALGHDTGWGGIEPVEFFRLLTQAAQMLDTRIRSSKDASIGTGDTQLDLWIMQHGIMTGGTSPLTIREVNKQFVSKFRTITDDKLRNKFNKLGVAFKAAVTGKAAERYGTITGRNLIPYRRPPKKGRF